MRLLIFYLLTLFSLPLSVRAQTELSLAGEWEVAFDKSDDGAGAHRWMKRLFPHKMPLPGTTDEAHLGDPLTLKPTLTRESLYQLARRHRFVGTAFYRRTITIPADWQGKHIELMLERVLWQSRVFVDGKEADVSQRESLSTPHRYDLTNLLTPGTHTILLRINNTRQYDISYQNLAHAYTDGTQTIWNGAIGELALTAYDPVHINHLRTETNANMTTVAVQVEFQNKSGRAVAGTLQLMARLNGKSLPVARQTVRIDTGHQQIRTTYDLGLNRQLWDEFSPSVYHLTAEFVANDADTKSQYQTTFGVRQLTSQNSLLHINGRRLFLRGTLECAIFPLTGHPPVGRAGWEKVFVTARQYGLNHLRFHSWCPPEAAFAVADRLGIYLQIESPLWANQTSAVGTGGVVDSFIYEESERILREYGNHPSFCLMAYGNEPGGANQNDFLGRWVDHFEQKDTRRLYTSGAGWPMIPENQFHVAPNARIQRWGEGLKSVINKGTPRTDYDWRETTKRAGAPYVSHEIGQWCAYPNFAEMPKYTGILKPTNFEIFKDMLDATGMGDQAADFLYSSGRLQTLCYKADIEAALRTPGFAGFQLLGLHDFPGQGSALVGALDVFWESKGYTTPEEYRTFCNPTVLLARMDKLIYENNETVQAALEIAHFGAAELRNQTVSWQLLTTAGKVVQSGTFKKATVAIDNAQPVGTAKIPLAGFKKPEMLTLTVALKGTERSGNPVTNSWNIWVYPAALNPETVVGKVVMAHTLTPDVVTQLQNGANVLLLPYGHVKQGKGAEVAIGFSSIFWNTSYTKNQPPHTLGLICNPKHPLFANFPTEGVSNYQWHDIVSHSQTIVLNDFQKSLRPLIQPIDDWFENRRLSLAFETRVGRGKLMVCSVDLETDIAQRPSARQLKYSLLTYMNSDRFKPDEEVSIERVGQLFQAETSLAVPAKQ